MKVAIIIVNYNGGQEIINCLQSLQVAMGNDAEIVVVDNASNDDSINKIKNKKAKIIENKRNLGFAAGANVGIKYALGQGTEAILLLNQDTLVEKGFLAPLLDNPAEIVAPVIKFKRQGKWVYDFGGRINWWLGRTTHRECSNVQMFKCSKENIDYVSGCAMLIRRKVLESIGLFDERYFLYFEDVDFCLRAKKAGFKIGVEPRSSIFHQLSGTEKKPMSQNLHLLKSNLIFINRYVPFWRRWIAYSYWLLLGIKMILK